MTLLEQRINGLTDDLSAAVSKLVDEVTPKSVHRLRTTIRRIETLISYVNPEMNNKLERSLEKLADLRKKAGKVRDLDVQAGLLDGVGNTSTAKDRASLTGLLGKKRGRQAERLANSLRRVQDSKFFPRMRRIAEKVGAGPNQENRPLAPLEEARAQLVRMADSFSRQTINSNRLHEARIQLKKVRYLAELAEETEEQKKFVDQLRSVQDALGEWHDWQELTKIAEKRFADRVNCALLREVRALRAARHTAATSAMTRLFALGSPPAKKQPRSAKSAPTLAYLA